ncbi:enoyl-CoA hydratase/isomerase family protein [Gordonia terrae]|uniref:Enoyl-CoA hydratase/isomerase family protein n=2 Tax=Gordonia terrae TaxID=2055 RepID=A0AAD0K5Y1_9ACTN|nr:enoyl-CoA hydratase/isomerase family protein [Gordonia terrae]VTR08826.1 3-hydroxybutyryl-CoA dehydratase [Clostridioides difficile]ANY21575.1 enoyl-CoA hydratase [Gordonia terrae]AWO82303.1 enoyl-CoA hydratase/isomerase family protein [Gordonia terrae]VTS17065.1 Probable enoyl-CoA hydratase echA8 [Gordonia terrae]GAB44635.1 putative enoyl-CoA hydratase [Gordonia terrae NBRC 100016]
MPAVLVERDGEITTLTLNRPDALNALNADLVGELTTALDAVDQDPGCRIVILTGAGRAFCAGLDLNGYGDDDSAADRRGVIPMLERQQDIAGLARRLHGLRQPVIAAVNGPAAGGGLALVCASDIRIGSTSSVYAVGFIRAGFSACDIGVSWLLPRLVGTGRAHELMLTGRKFTAVEAERYGLLVDLAEPEELLERAHSTAHAILANPPLSVELTKVGMWAAVESDSFSATVEFENRQQMITAMTEDRGEATAAFLEKRAPKYRRR